jgi:amino acid transporter
MTITTDYPGRNPGANSPAMLARSRGSASDGASPFVAKSAGGIHFTQKENSLLIGEYANILNLDEDKAIDAWAAWAVTVITISIHVILVVLTYLPSIRTIQPKNGEITLSRNWLPLYRRTHEKSQGRQNRGLSPPKIQTSRLN